MIENNKPPFKNYLPITEIIVMQKKTGTQAGLGEKISYFAGIDIKYSLALFR